MKITLAVLILLLCSCRFVRHASADTRAHAAVRVSVDKNPVKIGDEIHILVDHPPAGWSGEVSINGFYHLSIQRQPYPLHVTEQNGFVTDRTSEIFVTLNDSSGYEIPVENGGRLRVKVKPSQFRLSPENADIAAGGQSGRIVVTAPADQDWSVTGVPDWISIVSGEKGEGNGLVEYEAAGNLSGHTRSAQIMVGDSVFPLTQRHLAIVNLPYQESFNALPLRFLEFASAGSSSEIPLAPQWVLEDQPGRKSGIQVVNQGPNGSRSLRVDRQFADSDKSATQVWLPGIRTQTGAKCVLSFSIKASNPALVELAFAQRTAPFNSCGLKKVIPADAEWTEVKVPFQVSGQACDAVNNRVSFQLGALAGNLWIANFSIRGD